MEEKVKFYYIRGFGVFDVQSEDGDPPLALEGGYPVGSTLEDALQGQYVLLNAEQIEFYESNRAATTEEVWNRALTPPPPPHVPTLDEIKTAKIAALEAFDKQSEEFFIGGVGMWLDPSERATLERRIERAKEKQLAMLTLRYSGIEMTIPIPDIKGMLFLVDEYADATYDIREEHRSAIRALETSEAVLAYDFTTNWPVKLDF